MEHYIEDYDGLILFLERLDNEEEGTSVAFSHIIDRMHEGWQYLDMVATHYMQKEFDQMEQYRDKINEYLQKYPHQNDGPLLPPVVPEEPVF